MKGQVVEQYERRLALAQLEPDEAQRAAARRLDQLAAEDPQKAEVVKLRFFLGLSDREVAEALGLSERTVERYWAYSKAWLFRQLDASE